MNLKSDKNLSDRINELLGTTTAKAFCKKANIQESSFSNWRKGDKEPSAYNIIELAKAFGVTPNYLLGFEEKETAEERAQKVMNYTGLNKNALNALRKNRKNYLKMSVINYLLAADDLIEELTLYFLTDIYKDFENDKKYTLLPKKHTYTSRKHQSYDIVELLGRIKEKFTAYIKGNKNLSDKVQGEFWDKEIDRKECFRILGFRNPPDILTYKNYIDYDSVSRYAYATGIYSSKAVYGDIAYFDDNNCPHYKDFEKESQQYKAIVEYLEIHDGDTVIYPHYPLDYMLEQMKINGENQQSPAPKDIRDSIKCFPTIGMWIEQNLETNTSDNDDINKESGNL